MKLSDKKCLPCGGNEIAKLAPIDAKALLLRTIPQWHIIEDSTKLHKHYKFKNFEQSLTFVNKVAAIAEKENHHPDINFGWGYADVYIQTHTIGGLSENDFILASKIEDILD